MTLTCSSAWLSERVGDYVCRIVVAIVSSLDWLIVPVPGVEYGSAAVSSADGLTLPPLAVFFTDDDAIVYCLLNCLSRNNRLNHFLQVEI